MKVIHSLISVSLLAVVLLTGCRSKQPVVAEHHADMMQVSSNVLLRNFDLHVYDTTFTPVPGLKPDTMSTFNAVSFTSRPVVRHTHYVGTSAASSADTTKIRRDSASKVEFYSPRDLAKVGGSVDWAHIGLMLGLVLACLILLIVLVRR